MPGWAEEARMRPLVKVLAEARAQTQGKTRPAVERLTEQQAQRARESQMLEARPGLQQDFLRCR